jgi:hypothetical protein
MPAGVQHAGGGAIRRPTLPNYLLRYRQSETADYQQHSFEAPSSAAAFLVAQERPRFQSATLFQDGKPLCRLGAGGPGYERCWILI